MDYKCNRSFTSMKHKIFAYGEKIRELEYNSLGYVEQQNFTKIEEEVSSTSYENSTPNNDMLDSISLASALSEVFISNNENSSNFDSASSSISSDDFSGGAGGDSGGGGSNSEW